MTTLQEVDRVCQDKLKQMTNDIEEIRRYPELQARKNAAKPANATMKELKSAVNQLRKLANAAEDPSQKTVYMKRYNEYNKKVQGFTQDISALTTKIKTGPSTNDKDMDHIFGGDGGDMNTAAGVMNAAVRAQDRNLDILREIERDGRTVLDTGNAIADTLAKDDEKIDEMSKNLDTLQSNLNAAKGEVEWFARQMATDKCFLFLMVAVILGLGVLVFWKIYQKRKGSSSSTTTTAAPRTAAPPTPAPPTTTIAPPPTTTKAVMAHLAQLAIHVATSD